MGRAGKAEIPQAGIAMVGDGKLQGVLQCQWEAVTPRTKRKYLLWETEWVVFNEMGLIGDLPAGGCEMQWLVWHRGGDRAT